MLNNIEYDPDFIYLLELMPALYNIKEYNILPKLLSVIGFKSLIDMCEYVGGKNLYLPTVDELRNGILSLQWYYDINIKHSKKESDLPEEYVDLYKRICNEICDNK